MKRAAVLRSLVMVALVVVPAAADAPPDQYDFFTDANVTIRDKHTTLIWQRDGVLLRTHPLAVTACSPGRLPTIKELLTLLDEDPHLEYESSTIVQKMIDQAAFGTATPVDHPYWTSTEAPGQAGSFLTLDLGTGQMAAAASGTAYYRCVQ